MSLHYIEPGDDRSTRQAVYEAFADRSRPLEEAIRRALDVGIQRLGVELGFVTNISDSEQVISLVRGRASGSVLEPGDSCPLEEAYCRRTVELDSPLCVQDAHSSREISDAAYQSFGFGTYIGTELVVDGETYGTVCFADRPPSPEPFPESDQLFVELIGRLIGQAFERRNYETELERRNETLRKQTARAERIADTTFDLLFEIAPSGELTYVSTGAKTILGYPPETITGDQFADYIEPSSLPAAVQRS